MTQENDVIEMKRTSSDGETLETRTICIKLSVLMGKFIEKAKEFFSTKKETKQALDEIIKRLEILEALNINMKERIDSLEKEKIKLIAGFNNLIAGINNQEKKISDLQSRMYGKETEDHNKYAAAVRVLIGIVEKINLFAPELAKANDMYPCKLHDDFAKCIVGEVHTERIRNEYISHPYKDKINNLLNDIDQFNAKERQIIEGYLRKKNLDEIERYLYIPSPMFDHNKCEAWYCELKDGEQYAYVITPYVALPDFPSLGQQDILKAKVSNKTK